MTNEFCATPFQLKGLVLEGEIPVFIAMTDKENGYILQEGSWASIDWNAYELINKVRTSTFRDKIVRITPDDVNLRKHFGASIQDISELVHLAKADHTNGEYQAARGAILQLAVSVDTGDTIEKQSSATPDAPSPAEVRVAELTAALDNAAYWIAITQDEMRLEDDGTLEHALKILQVPESSKKNYSRRFDGGVLQHVFVLDTSSDSESSDGPAPRG